MRSARRSASGNSASRWRPRRDGGGGRGGLTAPNAGAPPVAALLLAEGITAPGDKIASLKQILVMWSRRDFPAVERYMADKGVPPEVERAVRSMHAIRQKQTQEKATRDEGQKS